MAEELPDVLRDRADEILSDPRYAANEPGLIDRALDRLGELIGDLLQAVVGGTSFGGVIVGVLILTAMVSLVIFFIVRYLPRLRPASPEKVKAVIHTSRKHKSRKEWLAEAADAESNGHYREAVRARYWATVAGLIDSDEIDDAPGSTVKELRAQFEADAARTDPFGNASDAFSDVWYGGSDAGSGESAQQAQWDDLVVGTKRSGS